LLVVPKSLLWNWQKESAAFTPELDILLHHGSDRRAPGAHFEKHDVVLTSYGTLRKDALLLQGVEFDTVVLDEAHSIKNAWTDSYKAASALRCERRIALTGTPVENHLGELWNLMLFLNPTVFSNLTHLRGAFQQREPSTAALQEVVLKSVRPFLLRRTKAEVAKELPDRIEKTLHVTQSPEERKLYRDLAEFYRRRILERRAAGSRDANGKQTAEALEALLRLRQAACHPGLLDEARQSGSSSKLDLLLEQLRSVVAGGHKALVFSQFTQLLQLVAPRLAAAGLQYAYLDGQTRDREREVERFQTDESVSVFLVSLKAGGVGLNLLAAEYVFLLDPWWNPAAEAQAIDRAHRIGQTNTVIAYRLLTRDTVEEKVAALQEKKRELAAALFADGGQFSARFTREDLEELLG
jgi:SNF2 family DNA or RNA helicase